MSKHIDAVVALRELLLEVVWVLFYESGFKLRVEVSSNINTLLVTFERYFQK